jgi:hypothetical protein
VKFSTGHAPVSTLSGSTGRTRSVAFEIHSMFWQRDIGSYFSFSNQLKEVITILAGFNLGARTNT